MMREYTKLATSIWHSERFCRLSDAGKLFYLYAVGSPSVNSAGYYKLKVGYAMSDLAWDEKKVLSAIAEVCRVGLTKYDHKQQVVFIDKHFMINPPTNSKHAMKVFSDTLSIAYTDFKLDVLFNLSNCLKTLTFDLPPKQREELDSLLIDYRYTETETETKTETETVSKADKNTNAQKPKFPKPDDVSPQVWEDHLKCRKAKRTPITQTALDGMRTEASKLGWTLEQALTEGCARGWGSFKAEWITKTQQQGKPNAKSKLAAEHAEIMDSLGFKNHR